MKIVLEKQDKGIIRLRNYLSPQVQSLISLHQLIQGSQEVYEVLAQATKSLYLLQDFPPEGHVELHSLYP